MKKIAVLSLVFAFALAISAAPVLAYVPFFPFPQPQESSDVDVENENEDTTVINKVEVEAETGDNEVEGDGGMIFTGDAVASSYIYNEVNSNYTKIRGVCDDCLGDIDVESENEDTLLVNKVEVEAETGDNEVEEEESCGMQFPFFGGCGGCGGYNQHSGGGMIVTGDAVALSELYNIINSNVTRIR